LGSDVEPLGLALRFGPRAGIAPRGGVPSTLCCRSCSVGLTLTSLHIPNRGRLRPLLIAFLHCCLVLHLCEEASTPRHEHDSPSLLPARIRTRV
jgi:hypothetical protein